MKHTQKTIAVFGAVYQDMFTKVLEIPLVNQVVQGSEFKLTLGGKAANKAVGLARLGHQSILLSRLGKDQFAQNLLETLKSEKVSTDYIATDPSNPTGVVIVITNKQGDHAIIPIEGVNAQAPNNEIYPFTSKVKSNRIKLDAFVCTYELPKASTNSVIKTFSQLGITTYVDAGPSIKPIPKTTLKRIDYLFTNKHEAMAITNSKITSVNSAGKVSKTIKAHGTKNVIITLGVQGAILLEHNSNQPIHFPALKVKQLDATAAGDAFHAAFISHHLITDNAHKAMMLATKAGAFAVTNLGAQDSLPTQKQLSSFQP